MRSCGNAAALLAFYRSSDVCFIHLDKPREFCAVVIDHPLAQPMEQVPGVLIPANPKLSL